MQASPMEQKFRAEKRFFKMQTLRKRHRRSWFTCFARRDRDISR